jgi:hypothetical protein
MAKPTTKFTLQPGKTKAIAITATSIARLTALERESSQLLSAVAHLDPKTSAALKSDINAFRKQVLARINALRGEIASERTKAAESKKIALAGLAKKIEAQCSDAIAVYRQVNKVLLRGSSTSNGNVFIGRSWETRKPRDSSKQAQKIFDEILSADGIEALRRNSIFTTGSIDQASVYGEIFIIFPRDGFKFSWCTKKAGRDITLDLYTMIDAKATAALDADVARHLKSKQVNFGSANRLVSRGFDALIAELKRIKYPNVAEVTLDKLIKIDAIKKRYSPTDQDFPAALKSNHEVLIRGEYYAVALGEYGKPLLDLLGINAKFKS